MLGVVGWASGRLGVAVFESEVIGPLFDSFVRCCLARGGFRVTCEGGARLSSILQRKRAARKRVAEAAAAKSTNGERNRDQVTSERCGGAKG